MRTARTERPGRRPARDARGFTLLELLIATALAAVLLMALWSLFSVYTNLFETGQARIERSQLARALLEQLADDLQSAIQDPVAGAPADARTSTPLRRFVLSGSSHELRLDVLQMTPLEGNPTPVGDSERVSREPSAPRVPELRTVYYAFREPSFMDDAETEDPPGLVRRELDFETPYAELGDSGFGGRSAGLGTSGSGPPLDEGAGEPGSPQSFTPEPVDDSVIWVPEVVRLEFRYFDGSGWSSQWNSLERKSLPVAVEVAIVLAARDERPGARGGSGTVVEPGAPESDQGAELGGASDTELSPGPEGPVYRLVVDLAGSPKHPAPQGVRPVAVRPPPPPPITRRIVPRRLPTRPEPTVRPLPDEWMRTQR